MLKVTHLVISRKVWLRGEGPGKSSLLRCKDGKMCCVGIYGRALGVPDVLLLEQAWPSARGACQPKYHSRLWITDGTEAAWLNSPPYAVYTEEGVKLSLASTNDDPLITEERRESVVARIFANNGVTVKFTD